MPSWKNLSRVLVAAVFAAFTFGSASAQTPANNRITLIVAFAPGGIADTLARLIAQGLTDRMHQTVVVENRAGAGGNIAAEVVAHAEADGATLLATTTAIAINETLFTNKKFAASDFKTVAIAASSPEALVTGPDNQATDLAALVKAANGKTLNLAIPGVGTGSDIEAQYFFKVLAKTPVQVIPFQGGAPAINATIGNQVDVMATTLGGGAAAQINGGKLKGLGIAADKRAPVTPNVPTYAELGFSGFTAASWVGFFAPAKTSQKTLDALNAAINDTVKSPDVQKKLADMGFDPISGSQTEADALFAAEVKKWGAMVKTLGLSIN
ncbi:MAG TPA: tripartite tricarboxylate transporter substrate-binding protein [Xanthobacteraceae bacterium]|jgi:tripartite-type tricarboxylate transporter receptor subunit TctC|nr:tripartite tricarboxylate transporter substrate-binding protein [Xanthobacteraceae bacterium]